jgi:hypothetical protein
VKVEALTEERNALKVRVEEMKFSGPGGSHRRKLVDDHEENLAASVAKLERARLKYERQAKILIGAKAGIQHLSDKLANVRPEQTQVVMTDDTIVDVMYQCEVTLVFLLQQTRGAEMLAAAPTAAQITSAAAAAATGGSAGTAAAAAAASSLKSVAMPAETLAARPYNQRILLPDTDGGGKLDEDEYLVMDDDFAGVRKHGWMFLWPPCAHD